MRLLALDQSSHTTGYAIFADSILEAHGAFTFNDTDIGDRLVKIRNKVISLLEEYNIDTVVFEDIQYQVNIDMFKKLAEVFGVIYELLTEKNIPFDTVLASSWKSTLNIKGKQRAEQKANARLYIKNIYSITPTQDECDAICIGLHFLEKQKKPKGAW